MSGIKYHESYINYTLNPSIPKFIKFCIVGIFGASLNYSIFFVLYFLLNIYYIISSAVGFIMSIFLAFYLNKKYTFKINNKNIKLKLIKYFLVCTMTLIFGLACLNFFVDYLDINVYIANIIVIGIQTLTNFIGIKLYVFKD